MGLPESLPLNSVLGRLARLPLRLIPNGTRIPVLLGMNRGRRLIKGNGPAAYWLGLAERHMQSIVASNVQEGDIVYDVGANFGLYSLLFSKLVGSRGHVYAFEPAPNVVAGLRAHLELNEVQNVTIIEKAVAGYVGESRFQTDGNTCIGHLDSDGKVVVPTTTLDLLVRELPPPDCIKMDIEGAELEALKAANECFSRIRPKLFLATHFGVLQSCISMLKAWNYEICQIIDDNDLLAVYRAGSIYDDQSVEG
jgi:FkbM family methyltransferase